MGNILSICCPQFRRGHGDGKKEPLLRERDEQPTLAPVVQEPPSPRQGSFVVENVPPTAAEVPVPHGGVEDAGEPTPSASIEPAPTDASVKAVPDVLTFSPAPFLSTPLVVPVIPEKVDTDIEALAGAVVNVVEAPAPIIEPVIVAAVAPIATVVPIERTTPDTIGGIPAITLLPPSALLPPAVQGSAVVERSGSPPRQSGPPRLSNSPQHPALVVKTHTTQPESPSAVSSPFLEAADLTQLPLSTPAVAAFASPGEDAGAESKKVEEEITLTGVVETAKDSAPISPDTPATMPMQTAVKELSPITEPKLESPAPHEETSPLEPSPELTSEAAALAPPAVIPQVEANAPLFLVHEQEPAVVPMALEVVPMALEAVHTEAPMVAAAAASERPAVTEAAVHEAIEAGLGIGATAETVPATLAAYNVVQEEDGDEDGDPEEKPLTVSVPSSSHSSTSGGKKKRNRGGKKYKKK
ncbi:hypothetical protein Vafri_1065 [Volvox africanus]|nr:hypothetical protein Vafri_1065 [Volvox africanus]